MPTIKLLKRAELELKEACEWYEKQQKGLSLYLRKDVKATLNFININPEFYGKRYDTDLQFAPLRRFPYVIIFWFDENLNTVFVTSIFHTKRNPADY